MFNKTWRLIKMFRTIGTFMPYCIAEKSRYLPGIELILQSRLAMQKNKFRKIQSAKNGNILPDISEFFEIRDHVFCQHHASNNPKFSGEKVALVAHWDPHGIVDPYVVHYLKALKNIGYTTILISAGTVHMSDYLFTAADYVLWRDCPGYDFTSWKAAFEYYPSLFEAREILVTNDSIFGPMHPLFIVHEVMDKRRCDFWGLVCSIERVTHLQSYYIVFRSSSIESEAFKNFFKSVDTTEDREETIARYELGLTQWLQRNRLIAGAYITPADMPPWQPVNRGPLQILWRQFLRDLKMPFLKRDIVTQKYLWLIIKNWKEEVAKTGYPVSLINDYLQRMDSRL